MRPRSKRQREVVDLSTTLPPITDRQRRWAYTHCFPKVGYQCKGEIWCTACGGIFGAEASDLSAALGVTGKAVCPYCGARLTVEVNRRKKVRTKYYFTVVTTCRGWQVCRNYSVERYIAKGDGAPYCEIDEAVQNWIAPDGYEVVIARPTAAIAGYYDCWQFHKPMALRDANRVNPYGGDKYHISGAWVYPERNLLPLVKRNGYTGRNQSGIPESEHIRMLLTDPEAEWLEKTGQFALLAYKYTRGSIGNWQHAVRVANRAGYKVKDAGMWIDYLALLDHFHLDTHNARYVCPRDLNAEHDRLVARKHREDQRREQENRIREAAKWEKKYRAEKGPYLGICFGNDNIRISVIQSVADMVEEGQAMHHCVFAAGYYKKKNSLILSARDAEGRRLETIEVSLGTFKVLQSRAKCNGTSPQHAEILELMARNMDKIINAAKSA